MTTAATTGPLARRTDDEPASPRCAPADGGGREPLAAAREAGAASDDDAEPAGPPPDAAAAAAAAAAQDPPREPERVLLHMPVGVRNASLFVIAFLMSVYALRWAQDVFVPLLMGALFCYALAPLVDRLVRVGLPRALAAAVVMCAVVGGLLAAGYALSDQANNLIASLPEAAHKLRETAHDLVPRSSDNKIVQVQKAALQLEQAAAESASGSAKSAPGVQRVQVVKPAFNIQDYLVVGTVRVAQMATAAMIVVLITYFLLAAGDTFRRKLTRIAGPDFGKRKITVQALNEIGEQIQRYLLVQLLTSLIVGVASGLAFAAIHLDNAAAWGAVAGVLNLIPYIGGVLICAATAIVALLQFGTPGMVLAVAGISIALHVVAGYMLTPWLTSRASRLNAVVVFIGVLAWGWLWGVWGLLLGTPILMVVKAICDRIDDLKPIGELLGGEEHDAA
jgi:predicted PurR-regulated permease PerM